MNNLLLILAMMLLSNGNISLFDNKNKSNRSSENQAEVEVVEPSTDGSSGKRSSPKVRKIKKIKKKTKIKDDINKNNKETVTFDMTDVNKGIKLLDLSDEDLDRGMEIITRTKKYMDKEERSILIKLESVLDLVKGIKKLNDINILSDKEESQFFRSMDEEDKKNMMIKEILEVFPEKKKQSVEKALSMKKKIDLLAELFLPEGEDGGGFSLSSLVDLGNLGSASNLKLLGSLLRGLDSDIDTDTDTDTQSDDNSEYEYVDENKGYEHVEEKEQEDYHNEYVDVNKSITNNKKTLKNKNKKTLKNQNRRKKKTSN